MATPTRQMSRPQVRPMQPFRQQQSQALRPAVQQPMQQPMQRTMQQPMQQAQAMQQPMQQRSQPMQQQKSPMVQRPQAMQPTPTRVQQPMQRGQLNAPAVMPNEVPSRPGGGGVMKMPETGGLEPNPGGNFGMMGGRGSYPETGGLEPNPGSNELSSTGQQGMPKYDPRGMPGSGYSGGFAGPSREEMAREEAQQAKYYSPGGGKDQAYAAEKQRQLDAGRAQREGALFNPPPPQKPVLQPGEVDMPIGHTGIGFGQDSPLARDNPQFGMPPSMPPEMNQMHRTQAFKRGGKVTAVKKYAKGGAVKSTPVKASSRGDGIAQRGKTKGKIY